MGVAQRKRVRCVFVCLFVLVVADRCATRLVIHYRAADSVARAVSPVPVIKSSWYGWFIAEVTCGASTDQHFIVLFAYRTRHMDVETKREVRNDCVYYFLQCGVIDQH